MQVDATTPNPAQPQATAPVTAPNTPQVAPEAKEAPKEDTSAKRFAALAKKEKSIQKQAAEAKALAEQTAQARKEFEAWQKQKAEEDEAWNRNPLDALNKKGWDYKKLTDLVLAGETPTPEMVAKLTTQKELKAWQKSQEEAQLKDAEESAKRAQEENQKAFDDFSADVKNHVSQNSDKYEYCNLFAGHEVAVELVKQQYAMTKRVLSKDEACEMAEKYFEGLVDQATATKKYTAKASPQPKADNKQSTPAPSRTLTNQLTPSTPAPRPLTREERIARAMSVAPK
jgi:hypothetical protein